DGDRGNWNKGNRNEGNNGDKPNFGDNANSEGGMTVIGQDGKSPRGNYEADYSKIEEEAKKHYKMYNASIREALQYNSFVEWLEQKFEGRYAIDNRIKNEIILRLIPMIAPQYYPPEVKPHTLIKGPPGTGKSYLVNELSRLTGVKQITLTASTLADPSVIESAFFISRLFRRASIITQMLEENIKVADIISKIAENVNLDSNLIANHIKDTDSFLNIIQPSEATESRLITSLKEDINKELAKKGNNDGITENYLISLINKIVPGVPVIIFIDEIDAVGSRDLMSNAPLNQLLQQIDSSSLASFNNGIAVVGITNRPVMIDEALTRSGRLRVVHMPYPSMQARIKIAETLIKRFEDPAIVFKDKQGAIQTFASIPFVTGADIKRMLEEMVIQKRVGDKFDSPININNEEIYKLLKNANEDSIRLGRFMEVSGRLDLLEALYNKDKIEEEPALITMRRAFFDALKENIDSLTLSIIESLFNARLRKGTGEIDEERLVEDTVVMIYNVLTRALPTSTALSHVIDYLQKSMDEKKGRVMGFGDELISSKVLESMQYLSLKKVIEHKSREDPYIGVKVDGAELLHGIVSVTPKNISEVKEKLIEAENLLIYIKNIETLFGTGTFNMEHTPKFNELVREARTKGHILIYGGQIIIDNTDYGLMLFVSESTDHIKGERDFIELLNNSKLTKIELYKEFYGEYNNILRKLTELVKTENLADPARFGHEYVRTSSALMGGYGLDRYLKSHKEVKKLVLGLTEFSLENSNFKHDIEEKAREFIRRIKGGTKQGNESSKKGSGEILTN
ncbi:MAG: AAA family ATPase, partial [Candidatus Anstonellales archaeon]